MAPEAAEWQDLRESLKGKPLEQKLDLLYAWVDQDRHSQVRMVQVVNYLAALSRAGMDVEFHYDLFKKYLEQLDRGEVK
jgi:hypothetical protein